MMGMMMPGANADALFARAKQLALTIKLMGGLSGLAPGDMKAYENAPEVLKERMMFPYLGGLLFCLEAGQEGKTKSATFDLSAEVLAAIRDGNMEYAIDQQQYLQGYLPVVILVLYNQYSLLPGVDVLTGPGFVTAANAADVIKYAAQGYR